MSSSPAAAPATRKRASPEKVRLYASFIGVDLDRHPYLYDLMEEGLRCPLPAGWVIRHLEPDDDGSACHEFFHEETGRTSNAHPMDDVFVERARALMRKQAVETAAAAAQASPANSKKREAGGPVSSLINHFVGSDDDDEQQQQRQTPGKDKFVSGGGNARFSSKKGSSSSHRSARAPSSPTGKKIRYLLYCFVFACMVHLITYSVALRLTVEVMKTQKEKQEQKQQQRTGGGARGSAAGKQEQEMMQSD
jgi:hypothetical protein